mmetsp:Transcript_12268/g.29143  ORF Transcript_12268/g.29143 Transcript_12268/m.29143 type:complete len:256 (+) Transcript_12268:228-995(+)
MPQHHERLQRKQQPALGLPQPPCACSWLLRPCAQPCPPVHVPPLPIPSPDAPHVQRVVCFLGPQPPLPRSSISIAGPLRVHLAPPPLQPRLLMRCPPPQSPIPQPHGEPPSGPPSTAQPQHANRPTPFHCGSPGPGIPLPRLCWRRPPSPLQRHAAQHRLLAPEPHEPLRGSPAPLSGLPLLGPCRHLPLPCMLPPPSLLPQPGAASLRQTQRPSAGSAARETDAERQNHPPRSANSSRRREKPTRIGPQPAVDC